MIPGLCGLAGLLGEAFTVEFISYLENEGNLTTYTFSGANLGNPSSARRIFLTISTAGSGVTVQTISSVTIGGVTADIHVTRTLDDDVNQTIGVGIVSAAVPSGATGDIVVTMSAACTMVAIGVFRVASYTALTAVDDDLYSGTTPVTHPLTVDVSANGAVLAVFTGSNEDDPVSWVGVTERYDDTEAGGDSPNQTRYSGAMSSGLGVEIARAVTLTQTFPGGGNAGGAAVAVSIR